MMYIKTIDELIFESFINESIIYYSPRFRDSLRRLSSKNKIAQSLCEIEGTNADVDLTFIDFGIDGYLTFQQMAKAIKLLRTEYPDATDGDIDINPDAETSDILYRNDYSNYRPTNIWKGNRNQIKIGKFVNRLFPNKFTDSDIENFVNMLKSIQNYGGDFKIVEGEEINKWYNTSNYESIFGTLGSSCMNNSKNLNIYIKNPENCKLLVLLKDGKLVARAILWKLHSSNIPGDPEWFLDRVYSSKDYDVLVVREEADKRGYAYRQFNGGHSSESIIFRKYAHPNIKMVVKVNAGLYKTYPYLDTFKYYIPRTGMLHNYDIKDGIVLSRTDGGFVSNYDHELDINPIRSLYRRVRSNIRDIVNPVPIIEKIN